jgi:hypothetical protein
MMNKNIFSIGLLLILITLMAHSQPSAKEIMQKTREVSKIKGMEAVSTLKIYDSRGRERTREISMASGLFDNGATEKRIIRFLAPAEVKGTGMLIFDYDDQTDDMWIYMPALRKTRRIVSSEKGQSFMGSEFSNADMAAPNLDDYQYRLLGSEIQDGIDCWKIEVLPVNDEIADETGVSREITWIGKEDFVTRKSEYYDLDNDLWKILTASDIRNITNGKFMAAFMQMENVRNERKSVFTFDRLQYSPDVKGEYFTVMYLEKP